MPGGDRGAELLGVGCAGVVEAGAVDRDDAQVGAVARRAGRSTPATASSSASSASAPMVPAAASPSGSAPSEPACRCSPTASAAACQRVPASSTTGARSSMTPSSAVPTTSAVTVVDAGEVEHDRVAPRSSSSTARPVRPRRRRAGARPTRPPGCRRRAATLVRGAAREACGVGRRCVGGGVQGLDGDAVVRRRAQPGHGGVRREPALPVECLGDRRGPLLAVGRRELPGQDEVGRHGTRIRNGPVIGSFP